MLPAVLNLRDQCRRGLRALDWVHRVVPLVVALAISSADASASTITLSDSTFAPANWNTFLLYNSVPATSPTSSGFQDLTTGLPAPSLGGTLVSGSAYSGFETMALVQQYVPSVLAPIQVVSPQVIDSVSMSFDFELFPNSLYPPAQILLQSVISQNGKYYFGPTPFTSNLVLVAQGWVHVTIPNLQSTDFAEMSPTLGLLTGSHPDFLTPFSVGIGVSRTTQIHSLPGEWRIDNWSTQVNVVPEPGTLLLTALGGLAVLAYRPRSFSRLLRSTVRR